MRNDDTPPSSGRVRLFQTLPHTCGYFPDRLARNLVIDPAAPQLEQIYPQALEQGFRRAGEHLYRPQCPGCQACVPCRIPVARFAPDRSQRRCLARNADLQATDMPAGFTDERFALYRTYLDQRHAGGGMDHPEPSDFEQFLTAPWSHTRFLEWRLAGELVAVAVTDCFPACLSAVYTFYRPDLLTRGLGTLSILTQLEWAQRTRRQHLYLGYWIAGHPKMDYKRRFQPLQRLLGDRWS